MMSSLVPGSLFYTPGLNRKSAPTSIRETTDHTDKIYSRPELDGNPWPYESPIHNMYDVRNTSTKMIILNNKYGKDHTRLRGYYTGPNIRKSERQTDPERHSRVNSPRNPHHHERCYHSGTPYFEPAIKPDIEWTNQTERPANSLTVRSAVNQKRHLHCIVPSATSTYTDSPRDQSPRPVSRISRSSMPPQRYFKEYADLTIGEKIYLWSIEKIYNIENLKRLKQDQYQKLLELEAKKGQNVSWKDYDKYMRYIQSASTRHYGTRSPSPTNRARSAMSTRSETARYSSAKRNRTPRDDHDTISRPRTTSSRVRRSKTVEPSSEKPKKQDDKNYEIHNDSESTTSKSEATKSSALKSEETTDKTTPKTDEEKLTQQPTKRPTSKTSQGHAHRPKSSASRSTKSTISPYATPLVTPSPYASRTSSAKSSRSSRPSSYKSTKSKTGSSKPSGKESSKEDHTEEKEVVRHKEGIDRPKSRLGHPSPVDKEANYFSDQKSDTSNDSELDFFSSKKPLANIKETYQADDSSVKSSDTDRDITSPMKITDEKEYKLSEIIQKSSDKENDSIPPKQTEVMHDYLLDNYLAKSSTDQEKIETQSNVEMKAEPKAIGMENMIKPNQDEDESFQTDVDFKAEISKDDIDLKSSKTDVENNDEIKDEHPNTDSFKTSVKEEQVENKFVEDEATSTNKEVNETSNEEVKISTDKVKYTDLKSKWKKENEDAAKQALPEQLSLNENQGVRVVKSETIKNESIDLHANRNVNYSINEDNEDNKKNAVGSVYSDEEDVDRKPNKDLDRIEY